MNSAQILGASYRVAEILIDSHGFSSSRADALQVALRAPTAQEIARPRIQSQESARIRVFNTAKKSRQRRHA